MNGYTGSQHTIECAISKAIDYCIENDILADILIKCKSEVTNMLLTEFDEKLYKKTVYREGYEDGVNEGFKNGISEGFERGISEARKQDIKNSITMLRRLDLPDEKIVSLITENYAIPEENVIKEINKNSRNIWHRKRKK